ncbi:MAG: sugar ABC transporter permease [Firmicutes bacterium]|nr:sugar ABC transporter permease [Bacillota bacterium]
MSVRTGTDSASGIAAQARQNVNIKRHLYALMFILPFLVVFIGFYVIPIIIGFHLALFVSVFGTNHFVWFQNFINVFTDPDFYRGLLTVLLFAVIQIPFMVLFALLIAFVLNTRLVKGSKIFRFLVFLPYAVPGVISALLWGYLYTPGISPIVGALRHMGLSNFTFLGPGVVLISIMNIVTWEWTGYNSIVFNSSLQAQPVELDEAATIEGATWWQVVSRIKFPLLLPTVFLVLIFSVVGSLQLFNEPFIISSLTSLPYYYTPNMYIYNEAFSFGNLNYAAALSFVLALFTFLASFLLMRYALPKRGNS